MNKSTNNYEQQKKRGLKRKWEIIQERGGKCERCGYDKNVAAIEFHHKDAKEKDFGIDMRTFSNTSLENLREELAKCDMLCSNCHRELHNPDYFFNKVIDVVKDIDKSSFSTITEQECPVCHSRFPKSKGKIYCSIECREKDKNYPTINEVNEQYLILKSWEKVAQYFGITRRIIQGIRNKNS